MKTNKKTLNILLIAVAAISFIGLIIGTFLDKQVTSRLGDSYNLFGILLTAFGVILTLSVGNFVSALLFFAPDRENKKWNIAMRIIGAVAFILFSFFEIKEACSYVEFPRMEKEAGTYKALMITFILLLNLGLLMLAKRKGKKLDQNILVTTSLLIVIIIALYAASTEVIKYIVSRPRPRVVELGEIAFRNWYQFKPFDFVKEGHGDCKSFVSGHSSNAACSVIVIPLLISMTKFNEHKYAQLIGGLIGALYVFVVAFSRIIAKAHYLSDVMAGILLSQIIGLLAVNITPKILNKKEK